MADELEDNLLLEEDGIAASGSEAGSELAGGDRAAEALQLPVAEGEDEAGEVYDNESLDGGDRNAKGAQQEGADAAQAKEDKKRKRKEKEKLRKQKRAALASESAEGMASTAAQPAALQADFLTGKQRKTFAKLSEMELDELRITERMLVETSSFGPARTVGSLAEFVRTYLPEVPRALADATSAANSQPGHPVVLVLSGNAQRSADLARGLRPLDPSPLSSEEKRPRKRARTEEKKANKAEDESAKGATLESKGITVAKLFARHFKLKEHESWLKDHVCPLAVGTPQRVRALVEDGVLSLDALAAVVIDLTWVDAKRRNILDTPETRDELLRLLAHERMRAAMRRDGDSRTRLVLF